VEVINIRRRRRMAATISCAHCSIGCNLEVNAALRVWRWTHSLPRARSFATVLCR
jgi:hypothetical protein